MDLDRLPDELIQEIDSFLPFEDSLHLQICVEREGNSSTGDKQSVYPRCLSVLSFYDSIQVCDDPNECFIIDSKGRKEKRSFKESNFSLVARSLHNLKEVTLMVKEANPYAVPSTSLPSSIPFKDTSVYSRGGFLSRLVSQLGEETLSRLSSITIHIDVSYETIKNHMLVCPTEDLFFALNSFTHSTCKLLIQISFGAMEYTDCDYDARHCLMTGMKETLEKIETTHNRASVEFVIDPAQGYTDMTIELPNLEYSFSFFYYNPSICDAVESKDDKMESEDEECEDSPSLFPLQSFAHPIPS